MNVIAWWKSRHTILKSNSLDAIDHISAGKNFKVRYLGCANLREDEICHFNQTADGLLNNFPRTSLKKLPTLELFIDSHTLSITDTNHLTQPLLEVSLTDVRDILCRKRDSYYGKICIFVARHVPLSSNLKAHVLFSDSYDSAKELYDSFCCAFNVFNNTTSTPIYREIPAFKDGNDIVGKCYVSHE